MADTEFRLIRIACACASLAVFGALSLAGEDGALLVIALTPPLGLELGLRSYR